MTWALYSAAILIVATGLAHSYLGERFILIRLFRRTDLPHLFGSSDFTVRTLRFAWHITTIAWFGLAALIVLVARDALSPATTLYVVAATCLASAALAAIGSRLRHLSWLVFLVVAGLLLAGAMPPGGW